MTLEMQEICKSFGVVRVLKNVDFSVRGGEICALIGENGAGKSTLMNLLGGVLQPDSGRMLLDGNPVSFRNPAESLSAGIAFIHQELNLINDLTIYENMFIGRELKKKNGLLDADAMRRQTQEIFDKMDFHLNPMTMVRDLDASYKQIVEIFRALMMNASIIIMDEPTVSLTDSEVERVFDMMRTLGQHGVGIVFISHKLKEVMTICDRFTVLRDGVMVKDGLISETSTDDLAHHMVGHELHIETVRRDYEKEREILRVENLSDETAFRGVSFAVHAGEVLGVTGLLGDGRSELFQTIFGVRGNCEGKIYVEGEPVHISSAKQSRRLGI
ncbi:MAG: sugar ABC transporter ATP-binding protein, partial [Faecalispora jeddahensis]